MNHSHDKPTNVLIVDQPFDADGNETPFGRRWGGERFTLTDILKMTDLFKGLKEASARIGKDFALWNDAVVRNAFVGANLTSSNGSIGSADEQGGSLDNSDTLTEVYGRPASTTQTWTGLNSDTTTSTRMPPN